jgi:hypothetical protein
MISGGGASYLLLLYDTQCNRRRRIYRRYYATKSTSEDGFNIYWKDDKQTSYKRNDVSFPFLLFELLMRSVPRHRAILTHIQKIAVPFKPQFFRDPNPLYEMASIR